MAAPPRSFRRAPAPAPIKTTTMRYHGATTMPGSVEVADTRSWSPPSTPSDSSSEGAAASPPHGATTRPAFCHPEVAYQQMMVNYHGATTKPGLAEGAYTGPWSTPSEAAAASPPHGATSPALCRPEVARASYQQMMVSYHGAMTKPGLAEVAYTGPWSTPSEAAAASPPHGARSPALYHPEAARASYQQMMAPHASALMPRQPVSVTVRGLATRASSQQQMMAPHESALMPRQQPVCGTARGLAAPSPRVEVRQVWHHNFLQEAALIESLMHRFRYVAVDTEFPGTVYRPAVPAYMLTAEKRYALLKANVDELDLIQLGLTLFNDDVAAAAVVWEFNFREFDVRRHRHAPESIAMLRVKGVDFDRTAREGVHAEAFGARLRKWLRAGLGSAGLVTFSGGYDLAYLMKVIFGSGYKLPAVAEEFEAVAKALLRRRKLFDVKEMARRCPGDLRGGLVCLAGKLNVVRAVGEAHQAGSDSLLTCHTFMKMKERYFDDDDKLTKVAGMLTGINDVLVDVVM